MEKLNYVEKLHNFLHKKKEVKPEILFTYKQVGGETVWQGKCSYVGKNYLVKGKSKKEVEHKIFKEIFELLLPDYESSLSTVKRNRKHRGNPSQARRDRKFKEKMSRFENFVWNICNICRTDDTDQSSMAGLNFKTATVCSTCGNRLSPDPPKEYFEPLKEEGGMEVVGLKHSTALNNKCIWNILELPVKKENHSNQQMNPHEMDIEDSVKLEVMANKIDPILNFKVHVTDQVKGHLFNYYAKDSKDARKKNGEMKEIKIKTESEFKEYCRYYSKKFQSDIAEAYTTMNGSMEGIEKENIKQYNIGYAIDRYFSLL